MPDAEAAVVVSALLDVPLQEVAAGQVMAEGLGVAGVEACPVPGLWRYEDEDAEDQRHQKATDSLEGVLARPPRAQGVVGGAPGQEEEQRHVPHADEPQDIGDGLGEHIGLDVEGVVGGVEDAKDMKRKEQEHGEHP